MVSRMIRMIMMVRMVMMIRMIEGLGGSAGLVRMIRVRINNGMFIRAQGNLLETEVFHGKP